MLKKAKKVLAVACAAALTLSMSTVAIAAGPGGGAQANVHSGSAQSCRQESRGSTSSNLDANQQDGSQATHGQPGDYLNGINVQAIAEAIAALSDDDADTLGTYISDYEDALADELAAAESADEDTDLSSYCEAVQTALQALLDAAEDADIDLALSVDAQDVKMGDSGKMKDNSHGMHAQAVAEAIAALSDDDADTLGTYISDYEDALADELAAAESADEDTDLSSYCEAVQTALQALLDAAEDADIDLALSVDAQDEKMGNNGNMKDNGHGMHAQAVAEAIAALNDDDADTLSTYISDYEDALADELAAAESADEDTDLSSYREAVQTALQALLDAAEDADIAILP